MLGSISNGLGFANLAEDICRSQMAEQVVGSDKAFRMAAEEMLGRALKKGELEDMMQKRMLDPEVLLPLVGKYFSQLANDGGALKEKLLQLETIEMRMKTQWTYFIRSLYDNGVEEAFKKLYKGLARVSNSMKQLASSSFGHFLKGALDMLSETALTLLDVIQIIVHLIDQTFGSNTDTKAFAAEILGMVVAAAALAKIFIGIKRTMMVMAGLSRVIAGVGAAGAGAAGVGIVGKVFIIGIAAAVGIAIGTAIREALGMDKEIGNLGTNLWGNTHQADPLRSDYGKFNVDKTLSRFGIQNLISPALMLNGIKNLMTEQKPQQVEVKVTMDKNAKDFVRAEVNQQQQSQYNMLLPATSKPFSYTTTNPNSQ